IIASIYQRPHLQGQTAVRLIIDHALTGKAIPRTHYLNPGIVMRSNLCLFREIRNPLVFHNPDLILRGLDGSA
ncbi:MAG TPA: hypothetical protein VKB60_05350, partial [Terriglobales bacterium]|nr:hypothetical protein [Terriglobales bacterium]